MTPKKPAMARGPRPYGQNKIPKMMRLTPETVDKLRRVSVAQGMSEAVYVELALRDRFKKDGIEEK